MHDPHDTPASVDHAVDFSCIGYLAATAVMAAACGGLSRAAIHVLAILAIFSLRAVSSDGHNRFLRALHGWYPMALIPLMYRETGVLSGHFWGRTFDTEVQTWENALFGTSPAMWLSQAAPYRWLSESLHLCYMSWWIMLPLVGGVLWWTDRPHAFARFMWTVVNALFFCYLCFILFPVDGPRQLFPPLDERLQGPVYRACHAVVGRGSADGAAFPSAHVVGALVILACLWRDARRLFWPMLPVCTGLVIATVYGRFHYALDVVVALPLSARLLYVLSAWPSERFPTE